MPKTTFVDGDPSQGTLGTIVTAAFLNALNNHRHRGLDVDGDGALDYAEATGSNNAYAVTLTPALDSYISGMPIIFKANHDNTGAVTLAVNGMTVKAIKKNVNEDMVAGDIKNGQTCVVIYDGTNFQISSVLQSKPSVPTGLTIPWPTGTVPTGYLECDGSSLSRTTYADLYAVIGTIYGAADGTHFNLPDYRGRFLRGWAHGQSTDPDRASRTNRGDGTGGDYVGTEQACENLSHRHYSNSGAYIFTYASGSWSMNPGSVVAVEAYTNLSGGNEARPININVMYIIKY